MSNMRLRLKYKTYCFADSFGSCLNAVPVFYDQRVKIPDDAMLCEKKEIYKECYFYNPPYTLLNTTRIFFPTLPKPITIIDGHIIGNFKYGLRGGEGFSTIGINRHEISLKTTDEKGLESFLGGTSVEDKHCFGIYSRAFFFSVNTKKIIQRQKLFLEIKMYGQTNIRDSCVFIDFYNNMELDIPVI